MSSTFLDTDRFLSECNNLKWLRDTDSVKMHMVEFCIHVYERWVTA